MNSYQLKWTAVICMVVDHMGIVFFPSCEWLRIIGRISFPVFAFLIVEGVRHTSNLQNYAKRLALFALISEIPYDLAFEGTILEFQNQNVFFTLFLSVCLLWIWQWERGVTNWILWAVFFCWLAEMIGADYGGRGIVLVLLFYGLQNRKAMKTLMASVWMVIMDIWLRTMWQRYAVAGVVLTCFYNGEEGKKRKKFFYWFYPVHLLALYILKRMI